jgi:hypothetical protein
VRFAITGTKIQIIIEIPSVSFPSKKPQHFLKTLWFPILHYRAGKGDVPALSRVTCQPWQGWRAGAIKGDVPVRARFTN